MSDVYWNHFSGKIKLGWEEEKNATWMLTVVRHSWSRLLWQTGLWSCKVSFYYFIYFFYRICYVRQGEWDCVRPNNFNIYRVRSAPVSPVRAKSLLQQFGCFSNNPNVTACENLFSLVVKSRVSGYIITLIMCHNSYVSSALTLSYLLVHPLFLDQVTLSITEN